MTATATATATDRLPRGRHNLSRDDVAGRQRARLLRALAEVLTERGYVDTPVAAVIARAGVSRETFYQQFGSKQDCFIAALEEAIGGLADSLAAVLVGRHGTPLERYEALLRGYLDSITAQPAIARLFLIETYAAGPAAMQRRLDLQQQFVDAIVAIFGARGAQDRFAAEALVAATVSAVTARFIAGDVPGLAALRPKILGLARALLG